MSDSYSPKMQGFINFPRQKLSDSEKTEEWYRKNLDFAENILSSNVGLRNSFKNKRTNYNLRANLINPLDFERFINPDQLDLDSLPASFQHIGIENNKINLLVGEYIKRKHDFRAYLSANDSDGISRKEQALKSHLDEILMDTIKSTSMSQEEIQKRFEEFGKFASTYQDLAEITANKILKREFKQQNLDFLFQTTFEDLLIAGEQIVYCGVLGGEPVMRRVNPENLFVLGGFSMNIEDADIIVEFGYRSVGQVIDDYWDVLKEEDVEFLERGTNANSTNAIGLNQNISVLDRFGTIDGLNIFHPNEMGMRTFAGAFDSRGNVRVMKACWRSRRKIGKLKYYDEDGQEQYDFVPEDYKPRKDKGEEVKWMWVNEWLEGTKIADHIVVRTGPTPFASKSMVNKSKGLPPYIGSVNSTNDYKVQSLIDIMKPLAYSYDIAYYKRELEIATYKGNFAAINASLIPSGWDPKEWIRYATVNKIAWLDPTNEILKGPSQGKSAGAFNTVTATNVQIGDPNAIQMYTNLLMDIENNIGKLAGVTGAREGQISNDSAVSNVDREITQTSHITEKWFAIDANFRKRALTKFLECCKYAYKKNPQKGYFILNDMEQVLVDNFDEFCMGDYDVHVSNAGDDTKLYQELKSLAQAAIQNGQAKISDLIAIAQSESVSEVRDRLEKSAKELAEQQEKMKQMDQQTAQMNNQAMAQEKQADRQFKAEEAEKDRQLKREEIASKEKLHAVSEYGNHLRHTDNIMVQDENKNGITDYIDERKVDVQAKKNDDDLALEYARLAEEKRKNLAEEEIKRLAIQKQNSKKD